MERKGRVASHTWNLCSAFNPSKCTHTAVSSEHTHTHTHCEHTPGAVGSQCCGARGAVGGSVPCSRVSPQLWYWGWRERCTFTPPTYNRCRTWDSNPQPSGYKSDSQTIRPLLPPQHPLKPNVQKLFKIHLYIHVIMILWNFIQFPFLKIYIFLNI